MALTTAKAFEEFLGRLEPTSTEKSRFDGRVSSVSTYLGDAFGSSSDMPLDRTRLIGSGAKGTAIHPVEDADVLAVFGNAQAVYEKYRWDSKQFLYRVRDALDGYRVNVVGARGQAVRLFYADPPWADIAPVLPVSGGGFFLPAGDGTWVRTYPEDDLDWFARRNAELNNHLKPMVRLAKAWNRTHSKHFHSFHLEVMVAAAFTSLGADYRHALHLWFENPHITVSAPSSGDALDAYMPYLSAKRQAANSVLQSSAERAGNARAAEARGDHRESIRLWRIILGGEFPAYG